MKQIKSHFPLFQVSPQIIIFQFEGELNPFENQHHYHEDFTTNFLAVNDAFGILRYLLNISKTID